MAGEAQIAGDFYASIGASATVAGNFLTSRIQFKMDESARKHRDIMSQISKRLSLAALTDRQISTRDAFLRTGIAIDFASKNDKANAELSAAAAGVAGVSVRGQQTSLERSRLNALNANSRNSRSARRAGVLEKRNVELASIFGRDISVIVPPSFAAAALGLGVTLLDQWDSNQPKGDGLMSSRLNLFQ